jgi:hypothetical protein
MGVTHEAYGDLWWTSGIPLSVRQKCMARREEEGTTEKFPPEAYMTLIDLRDVAQYNWPLVKDKFEHIANVRGKDKATRWLVELNEVRNLWAHPLKRLHVELGLAQVRMVEAIHRKVVGIFGNKLSDKLGHKES